MSRKTKFLILALVGALFLTVTVLVSASVSADRNLGTCKRLNPIFDDGFRFLSNDDIDGYIEAGYGSYVGVRLDSLKLYEIEEILDSRQEIRKSQVWLTPDGILNVKIDQRVPVLRLEMQDVHFFCDDQGYVFPAKKGYDKVLPVIDGKFNVASDEWIASVLGLVRYMKASGTWDRNIVQMHSMGNGEIVMIPRNGKEKIIFGKPGDVEAKFRRLEKYYTCIVPEKGEGYYSTVDVRYKGQIICRK